MTDSRLDEGTAHAIDETLDEALQGQQKFYGFTHMSVLWPDCTTENGNENQTNSTL